MPPPRRKKKPAPMTADRARYIIEQEKVMAQEQARRDELRAEVFRKEAAAIEAKFAATRERDRLLKLRQLQAANERRAEGRQRQLAEERAAAEAWGKAQEALRRWMGKLPVSLLYPITARLFISPYHDAHFSRPTVRDISWRRMVARGAGVGEADAPNPFTREKTLLEILRAVRHDGACVFPKFEYSCI